MEGREVPVGWVEVPIGELCDLRNGRAFKPVEWSDTGIPIVRIQNLNNSSAKFNFYQGQVDAKHLLRGGELLFAWSGTPGTSFGAHIWDGGKAALNQHIFRVDFYDKNMDKVFFRFAINQKLNELIDIAHGGVGLRHVTKGKFEATSITLPPLNEQRRIAAKLDTTLAAVEACRQRLDGVAAILKRFRQAVLAAATSGELTREWREERGITAEWKTQALSGICVSISDGDHQAPPKSAEGIPFITISAINGAVLRLDRATRFVPRSYYDGLSDVRKAREDDILFSVTGSVGIPALVDSPQRFVFQRHIALLRPDRAVVLARFLYFSLLDESVKRQCLKVATGTAQLTISLGSLRSLTLSIPSLQEQAEVVSVVEDFFSLADQLEARLHAARKIVDRLTPALLAKAFRGELVPQDPGDEPASVLLERVRAARQAEAGAGKPSRRGRSKAAANPEPVDRNAAPVPSEPLPPDLLTQLLRECGAISERALLAVSELEPERFEQQLFRELEKGTAREVQANGQVLLEAVG